MPRQSMTPVSTTYKLSELYEDIAAIVAKDQAVLDDAPEHTHGWPYSPKARKEALERVMDQIQQWQGQGYEYAKTPLPFPGERETTPNPEASITTQFGCVAFPARIQDPCKVMPMKAEEAKPSLF